MSKGSVEYTQGALREVSPETTLDVTCTLVIDLQPYSPNHSIDTELQTQETKLGSPGLRASSTAEETGNRHTPL